MTDPPMVTHIFRAKVSVQKLLILSMITVFPFSSAIIMGVAETSQRWKEVICNSGKARPIPSQSKSGIPVLAATDIGIIELTPPASMGRVA